MDYREDPLDRLLDNESDEEFGEPVIRDSNHHNAREDVDGNLKSWTAEDFASIYHRFRPHLVRHARRYLSNETQAEEVVQDAFLFLMTALPEIDNELGVLKFLKWKIKYLSLNLIRAESKSTNLEPNSFDQPSDGAPVDEEVLRADDAAVIRMALAKLNPRHREALMASVNEEKSSQQLAQELGTNENAARQLVFRARQAFKKALLGDLDTTGLSTNAIISIAIRKAAAEARENATKVGAMLVLASLGVFSLMQTNSFFDNEIQSANQQQSPPSNDFGIEVDTESTPDAQDDQTQVQESSQDGQAPSELGEEETAEVSSSSAAEQTQDVALAPTPIPESETARTEIVVSSQILEPLSQRPTAQAGITSNGNRIVISNGSGFAFDMDVDLTNIDNPVTDLTGSLLMDGQLLEVESQLFTSEIQKRDGELLIFITATDLSLDSDDFDSVIVDSDVSSSAIRIRMAIEGTTITMAQLFVSPSNA